MNTIPWGVGNAPGAGGGIIVNQTVSSVSARIATEPVSVRIAAEPVSVRILEPAQIVVREE